MERAESMRSFIQEIIDSYETRITAVGMLIDATHEMLQRFRDRRVEMSTELKEKLASSESLRHRDFDCMMQGVYLSQEEREKQIKHTLKDFLQERRQMAVQLKMLFADSRDKKVKEEKGRMEDFRAFFSEIKARHDAREREVTEMLQGFHQEQENLSRGLKGLIAKGESVRIKDVKEMLKRFHREDSEWQKCFVSPSKRNYEKKGKSEKLYEPLTKRRKYKCRTLMQ